MFLFLLRIGFYLTKVQRKYKLRKQADLVDCCLELTCVEGNPLVQTQGSQEDIDTDHDSGIDELMCSDDDDGDNYKNKDGILEYLSMFSDNIFAAFVSRLEKKFNQPNKKSQSEMNFEWDNMYMILGELYQILVLKKDFKIKNEKGDIVLKCDDEGRDERIVVVRFGVSSRLDHEKNNHDEKSNGDVKTLLSDACKKMIADTMVDVIKNSYGLAVVKRESLLINQFQCSAKEIKYLAESYDER